MTGDQITANLQNNLGVRDSLGLSTQASLSNIASLLDNYVTPATAPLNDLIGLGEKLTSSIGLPPIMAAKMVIYDPPDNILITTPNGK